MQAATALVVALYFFDVVSGGVVRGVARSTFTPAYRLGSSVVASVKMSGIFYSRATLAQRNAQLENQIIALTPKAAAFDILKEENTRLQALLNMSSENDVRAARVIVISKASPYGTFIIDSGSSEGITVGNIILIEGGFVIGTIINTTAHTAMVSELFASGQSLEVLIEGISAKIDGSGGGNAIARLPRGAEVREGSVVTAQSFGGAPVGIVGKVEIDPASAYSVVYVRTPVNIASTKYVYVRSLVAQ